MTTDERPLVCGCTAGQACLNCVVEAASGAPTPTARPAAPVYVECSDRRVLAEHQGWHGDTVERWEAQHGREWTFPDEGVWMPVGHAGYPDHFATGRCRYRLVFPDAAAAGQGLVDYRDRLGAGLRWRFANGSTPPALGDAEDIAAWSRLDGRTLWIEAAEGCDVPDPQPAGEWVQVGWGGVDWREVTWCPEPEPNEVPDGHVVEADDEGDTYIVNHGDWSLRHKDGGQNELVKPWPVYARRCDVPGEAAATYDAVQAAAVPDPQPDPPGEEPIGVLVASKQSEGWIGWVGERDRKTVFVSTAEVEDVFDGPPDGTGWRRVRLAAGGAVTAPRSDAAIRDLRDRLAEKAAALRSLVERASPLAAIRLTSEAEGVEVAISFVDEHLAVSADRPAPQITDEMVERAAEAGHDAWNDPGEWDEIHEHDRRKYRTIVRAALRAALGDPRPATAEDDEDGPTGECEVCDGSGDCGTCGGEDGCGACAYTLACLPCGGPGRAAPKVGDATAPPWVEGEIPATDRYLPVEVYVAGALSTHPPFREFHPQWCLPLARVALDAFAANLTRPPVAPKDPPRGRRMA